MNHETKRIKVFIFDQQYSLVSDETEDVVRQAAFLVDKYMQELAHSIGISDAVKIAVLTALHIATEKVNTQNGLEMYEEKCKNLIILIQQVLPFTL